MLKNDLIRKGALCELARRSFYDFCCTLAADFYKPNRTYLKTMCDEAQDFISSDDDILIINAPPRHGKSRTGSLLSDWVFGKDPTRKIMIGSYNETLSQTFSKDVRNTIDTDRMDEDIIVYKDIFPNVNIKRGDGAYTRWSLQGQHASYLATSPKGTATGFGADLLIIDDLIKSDIEANNADVLQGHWDWFTNTMLSRLEEGGKIIIIMTRWHSDDLAGRALKYFADKKMRHINLQALQEDGTMLCDEILSYKSYISKTQMMGADIASANYQQIPIDIMGKLYSSFKTYSELPKDSNGIRAYCDTADEGKDYLCNIIYADISHEAYVLDVYYTKEPMEITEPETAKRLTEFNVNVAKVESNNGGRGFARTLIRLLTNLRNYITIVKWFHQSKNKNARILTNSTWVMEHFYLPENWRDKFPDYYTAMTTYQKEGKNAHDDAPDATTGVAEDFDREKIEPITANL